MAVVLIFAGALSWALVLIALIPFGWIVALAGAPCAASALVLALALMLASIRRSPRLHATARDVKPELAV